MSISVIISAAVFSLAIGLVLVGIAYVLAHAITGAVRWFVKGRHYKGFPQRIRQLNGV